MDSTVSLIFKGIDQLTGTVDQIHGKLGTIGTGVDNLNSRFSRFGGVLQGIATGIGIRIFDTIAAGIDRVVNAIPGLIGRGEQFATVVRNIVEVSGMLPEQASTLATAANILGVSTDSLSTGLARLSVNAVTNEAKFAAWGITIAKNTDGSVNLWQTLQNLRTAISDNGFSATTTAAALQTMGRGASDLIPLLSLTNDQFAAMSGEAQRAGTYLTQAGLDAATEWERTQNRIQNAITGVGTQILGNLAPTLSTLVDTITNTIEANMTQIVNFVSQVVNFIAGLISGLLGVTLVTTPFAASLSTVGTAATQAGDGLDYVNQQQKKASSGTDAHTAAINKQIAAIDAQIAAMTKRDAANKAEQERNQILLDIVNAQAQLSDLQTQGVFTAGLSAAEAELLRQKHAADIVDAQKAVSDAQQRLADHDQQVAEAQRRQQLEDEKTFLQKKLQLYQQHLRAMANLPVPKPPSPPRLGTPDGRTYLGSGQDRPGLPTPVSAIEKAAADAKQAGIDFAVKVDGFIHSAGDLVGKIGDLINTLGPFLPYIAAGIAVKTGGGMIGSLLKTLGIGGATAVTTTGGGGGLLGTILGAITSPLGQISATGSGGAAFAGLPDLIGRIISGQGFAGPSRSLFGDDTSSPGYTAQSTTAPGYNGPAAGPTGSGLGNLLDNLFGDRPGNQTTLGGLMTTITNLASGSANATTPTSAAPNPGGIANPANRDMDKNLATIATAVSPGGQFFQQGYDHIGVSERMADSTQNTDVSTAAAAASTQSTVDAIIKGITVNSAPSFTTGLPGHIQANIAATAANTDDTASVLSQIKLNNGRIVTATTGGTPYKPKTSYPAAMGLLGMSNLATDVTFGEAGREAVAIVRNPKSLGGAAELGRSRGSAAPVGAPQPLHVHLSLDGKQIAEATVEDLMAIINLRYRSSSTGRFS